jgi:hypothetical protein
MRFPLVLITALVLLVSQQAIAADTAPAPAPAASADPNAGIVTDPVKVTVKVTKTGKKYHTEDCKAAKDGSDEPLSKALADGLEPCSLCHPPVYDPSKITVFLSGDDGKKYHAAGCRYAKTKTTLADAQAKGLEPCKLCNPPPLPDAQEKPSTTGDTPKK